jgi:L-ascorbate metabolism protein UlaG (beta-lactamase superfamily)
VSTDIRFLGVAGYEVIGPRCRFLVDPFLTGNPAAPCHPDDLAIPDAILVSHAAWDHFGDTAQIALRTGSPVVCGIDVRHILVDQGVDPYQIMVTVPGLRVNIGEVNIQPVESRHWSSGQLNDGTFVSGPPMGFIVETEPGIKIYHYGDSAIFDMTLLGKLYQPSVGIFGITLPEELLKPGVGKLVTGEMSPTEGALAAEMLGVTLAFAAHYLTPNKDTEAFVAAMDEQAASGRRVALVPHPGEVVRIHHDLSYEYAK